MIRRLSLLMILLFLHQVLLVRLWAQTIITAQVTDVSGSQIEIDRGLNSGLIVGTRGVVYYMQPIDEYTTRVKVALVKIVSVKPGKARLEIIDSTADIAEGYRVDLSIAKKGGSKWWIWLIVAAAGGGVAAAVSSGGGGGEGTPPPTTGTITYDIPAN